MAFIFKPQLYRYILNGKRVPPDTPGAQQVVERAAKWYAKGVPGWPPSKTKALATSKAVAQRMLQELIDRAERGQAGMVDLQSTNRPLADHLNDYLESIRAGGATAKHIASVAAQCSAICTNCRFMIPAEITSTAVERFLSNLAQDRPAELPNREWWTRGQIAHALGITEDAVSKLIRRHRFTAEGNGRSRRYPHTTAQSLATLVGRGCSPRTRQAYLVSLRGFVRWLMRRGVLAADPLADVRTPRPDSEIRRARRSLSSDELARLLLVTRSSSRVFRGLSGVDREHLYLTACGTGFREGELATLTPTHFDLTSQPPMVRLGGRLTKNRRKARQPLGADVAAALREYLADRPMDRPVWPGTWSERGAEMIREDLREAGVEYSIPDPDGDGLLYADFHALRHSYITLLDQAGVSLAQAMALARHSDPRLTAKRYTHTSVEGLASAVDALPIGNRQPSAGLSVQEWGWLGWYTLLVVLGVVPNLDTADERQ